MIVAGIDCGTKNTRSIIIDEGRIIGRGQVLTGFEQSMAVKHSLEKALQESELDETDLARVGATGAGAKSVAMADVAVNEARAIAAASIYFFPSSRLVVDVGAEETHVVRFDETGSVEDFTINDRCAAGSGSFIEAMARALETSVDEIGEVSLASNNPIPMNAQCAIFAESEVIGLLHSKTPKEDIARAIHDAIASRIVAMIRRVRFCPDMTMLGGLSLNNGFIAAVKRELEIDRILIPDKPEYGAALGAALVAARQA